MEKEREFHLSERKVYAELIVIFRGSVKPEKKPFVDPVDDEEVECCDQKQDW